MAVTFKDVGQATNTSWVIPADTSYLAIYAQGAGGSGANDGGGGGGRGNGAAFWFTGALGGKTLLIRTGTGGAAPASMTSAGNNGTHTEIEFDNGFTLIAGGAECAVGGKGGAGGNTAATGSVPGYVTDFGQFNLSQEAGDNAYGNLPGHGGGDGDSGGGGDGGALGALGNAGIGGYVAIQAWADPVGVLPSQTGHSGKFLTTNGTAASWAVTPSDVASQTGNSGKILSTNGTSTSWIAVPTEVASQSGQAGKYLSTDGTNTSWGIPSGTLPSQSGQNGKYLTTDGTNPSWATGTSGGREVLTGNRTYYVRIDGSDSNDGLTNSSGGAFLTLQKAIDTVASIDLAAYAVTVQVGDGTYTGGMIAKSYLGAGPVTIQGNTGTPANVLVSPTGADGFRAFAVCGKYILNGMKIQTTTSGHAIYARDCSSVALSNVHFGAVATNFSHVASYTNAIVVYNTDYTIAGSAARHILTANAGIFTSDGVAHTITLTGTPAFSSAFVDSQLQGLVQMNGQTFSGSATGKRYSATLNGVIDTIGGGANYFPGNTAGTTATGGQYA